MATRTFTYGGVDHLWSTVGNWDTGVPVDTDTAVIPLTQTCIFDVNQSAFGTGITLQVAGELDFATDGTVWYLKLAADFSPTGTVSVGTSGTPIPAAPDAAASPAVGTIAFNGVFSLKASGAVKYEMWGEQRAGRDVTDRTQNAGDSEIRLATGFTLRKPDRIVVSRAVAGANARVLTVESYNAGTRVVTLSAPLAAAVAVGDRVALLSRCIEMVNLTNNTTTITSVPAGTTIKGVRFYANNYYPVSNATGFGAVEYCTSETGGATYDFFRGCAGTFKFCHCYNGRSLAYGTDGAIHEDALVFQAGALAAYTTVRCTFTRCEVWNTASAAFSNDASSHSCIFDACSVNWCSLGMANGGTLHRFFGCSANNCTNGAFAAGTLYDCEFTNCTSTGCTTDVYRCYADLKLYNCLFGSGTEWSWALANAPKWVRWVSNAHDQTAANISAYMRGGALSTQTGVKPTGRTRAYQIVLSSATDYGWFDFPSGETILLDAGETITFDVWLRQNEAALTNEPQWQIVDPANDPLVDSTKSALASYAPDLSADTWYQGTVAYTNPGTSPLPVKLRLIGRDATATIYGEFDEPVRFMAAYDYGFSR